MCPWFILINFNLNCVSQLLFVSYSSTDTSFSTHGLHYRWCFEGQMQVTFLGICRHQMTENLFSFHLHLFSFHLFEKVYIVLYFLIFEERFFLQFYVHVFSIQMLCNLQNKENKIQFYSLQNSGRPQESTFAWFQVKSTVKKRKKEKKPCLIKIIRLYMSLSEACFNLHFSFLRTGRPTGKGDGSCSTAHSHSGINTMQRNKTWMEPATMSAELQVQGPLTVRNL